MCCNICRSVMQILLINPAFYYLGKDTFPLGLGYLASVAIKKGASVTVIDENVHDEIPWNQLGQYDIIGLSITTPAFSRAMELISQIRVRKAAKALIIAGGHHPTFRPEDILNAGADIVFRGEAEVSFGQILDALNNRCEWFNIPGLSYFRYPQFKILQHNSLQSLIEDLDEIPFPIRDMFRYSKYSQMSLITSRGCPYQCSYCAAAAFWGHKIRFRSVSNIIAELDEIMQLAPFSVLKFQDSVFTVNKTHTVELLQAISNKGYHFQWICETRADLLDKELIQLMKQSGCKEIMIGFESGSPTILQRAQRQISVEKLVNTCKEIMEQGIGLRASVIYGLPNETNKTVKETLNVLNKIQPNVTFLNLATVYPGCPLEKQNIKTADQPKLWVRNFGVGHGQGSSLILPDGMTSRQYRKLAMYFKHEIHLLNTINWD